MPSIRSHLTAALATGALVVSGFALVDASASATTRHSRHHHDHAVQVYVDADSTLTMPTTLRAGTRRFVVRSAGDALFQLVRPRHGYTKRQFVDDANAAFVEQDLEALKRFESGTTLLGGVSTSTGRRAVMWSRLHRGTYWAADVNPDRIDVAKVLTVRVHGRSHHGDDRHGRHSSGRAPRPDAVIRAINEAEWSPRPRSIPGAGVLSFRNDSIDNHFLGMARLLPGKTIEDVTAWIEAAKQGNFTPEPVDETVGLGTGVLSPGHRMSMRYDLPAGHYVMVCWWPDAEMGGQPHAFMGMYREIVVR